MSVDFFWKRVPASLVDGADPGALRDMVPTWADAEWDALQQAGVVASADHTMGLIPEIFRLGADDEAVNLFACPSDRFDDRCGVDILPPATVRRIAEAVAAAPLDDWATGHAAALTAQAHALGFGPPLDVEWIPDVIADAKEVAALFGAAADAGEAVILKIS